MIDFIMQAHEDGVVFLARSDKARDWCVENLQQMADPIYDADYADAAKQLFGRMGFEVLDTYTPSSLADLI